MPKYDLDAVDRRIVAELQGNGRLRNVELAEKVGLSPSPCLRRVAIGAGRLHRGVSRGLAA
jgi:Lrp/AsnC family transcriptional regulator, leucine-responsive regulatory protein